jgi:membrane protease YdiL (CAAX protease family)
MSISSFTKLKHHPFLLVGLLETGVVTIFLGVSLIIRNVIVSMNASDIDLAVTGIGYSMLSVGIIILLNRLKWWGAAGFRRPYRWHGILLFWLPMLPLILNFVGGIFARGIKVATVAPWRIGIFLVVSLLVGFVEEGIFRGMMVRALYVKGIWTAAVMSSVLFGLAHSVNIVLGENIQAVALQLVYTTTIYGFASAAIVIYTGTLWPIVVIHSLIDFVSWLQAGTTLKTTGVTLGDIFITAVGSVLAIGYGIVLLVLANRVKRGQPEVQSTG